MCCSIKVPKGFFPTALYSTFFLTIPLLFNYVSYDFTTDMTRAGVVVSSVVVGGVVILANDCVAWFNVALYFHIGVEVIVLDRLMTFAQNSTTDEGHMALAWTTFAVVIVHLLPFLLFDRLGLLALLAYVGIVVNASVLVFLDPTLLLLVGFSSTTLLGATLLIAGIDCINTSMLSNFRSAMKDGSFLLCQSYEA